jgi:hypothetical protein
MFILEDIKVPAPAEFRAEILEILSQSPQSAKSLLESLPSSPNKKAIATAQRLSRFLGLMAGMGLIKGVRPTGGPNVWSVLR